MSEPILLYTPTDIAMRLGVTNAAVTNWVRERPDCPTPSHKVSSGSGFRYFWSESGMRKWEEWLEHRKTVDPYWRDNR